MPTDGVSNLADGVHEPAHGFEVAPTSADPDVWAPWLGRLLDRQFALYQRLEVLSRDQSAMIVCGDTESLLKILGRRQEVIDEIESLNAHAEPVLGRWEELSASLPERYRAEFRRKTEAIDHAVAAIAERDEADRLAMERERNAIADELSASTSARVAIRAYGAGGGAIGGASFQDRRG